LPRIAPREPDSNARVERLPQFAKLESETVSITVVLSECKSIEVINTQKTQITQDLPVCSLLRISLMKENGTNKRIPSRSHDITPNREFLSLTEMPKKAISGKINHKIATNIEKLTVFVDNNVPDSRTSQGESTQITKTRRNKKRLQI
jgi:hypothetical protein